MLEGLDMRCSRSHMLQIARLILLEQPAPQHLAEYMRGSLVGVLDANDSNHGTQTCSAPYAVCPPKEGHGKSMRNYVCQPCQGQGQVEAYV